MRLGAAQSVPVSEEAAIPRIQQFLGNQRAAEAAKQEFKELKAKANITYMGEFADKGVAAQNAPVPAVAQATDVGARKSGADINVENGVAGLQ